VQNAARLRFVADLGLRIVELRERRGLTQAELAERIDMSTRYVQKLEAGEANVALFTLGELAAALRCSVAELFAPAERRIERRRGRPKRPGLKQKRRHP
jgi:transcriptional regulator with XRE-family HTH domain